MGEEEAGNKGNKLLGLYAHIPKNPNKRETLMREFEETKIPLGTTFLSMGNTIEDR